MKALLCQKCMHLPATTHITVLSHGFVSELHLCQRCEDADKRRDEKRCGGCGLSFRDIQSRGRFGCAMDYTTFEAEIITALENYHGSSRHVGKIPSPDFFSS